MKNKSSLFLVCALGVTVCFADTPVKMESLPAPVRKAVADNAKDGEVAGLSKEKENGKTVYEAEIKSGGHTRTVSFDASGSVLEIEREVELASLPPAAKAALETKASGGAIQKVESVTRGSVVSYEAAIKTKAGKKMEVAVNADGTPHK